VGAGNAVAVGVALSARGTAFTSTTGTRAPTGESKWRKPGQCWTGSADAVGRRR
jgi:nicotinamide mononucleotide (NMN) deamidase PncC